MKTKLMEVKTKAADLWLRAKTLVTAAMLGMAAAPQAVSAASDPGELVKAVIDVVVKIFPFIGAFFIVSGVFKLILAYRNDQPEAQAGAAKDIVVGAVFVVFAVFVWDPIKSYVF